jgi:hypothetical protein
MSARRSALLAAAGLLLGAPAAAAERATAERVTPVAQAGEARPAAVLASAAAVDLPAGIEAQPAAAPAPKRRAARVTSCRCGDQVSAETGETPQR